MKQIRKRLTYANVMSTIAVFLVIGGATAFAALGKNSVGSKQLKKNAVVTAKVKNEAIVSGKIANNAVSTTKIADGAVNGAKVLDGSLTGSDINVSTLGTVPSATKATTATKATEATQATKLSHVTVVKVDFTVATGAGSNTTETASCPAGTQAIGGGARNDPSSNNGAIITSRPVSGFSGAPATGESFDGWRASITNTAAGVLNSSVWAICAG